MGKLGRSEEKKACSQCSPLTRDVTRAQTLKIKSYYYSLLKTQDVRYTLRFLRVLMFILLGMDTAHD